jgi:hypothetical protein
MVPSVALVVTVGQGEAKVQVKQLVPQLALVHVVVAATTLEPPPPLLLYVFIVGVDWGVATTSTEPENVMAAEYVGIGPGDGGYGVGCSTRTKCARTALRAGGGVALGVQEAILLWKALPLPLAGKRVP